MKRITLLAILALMVAVVVPVMATDFSYSGEVTLSAITDFAIAHEGFVNYWLNLDAKVNDNLSAHAELGFNPNFVNSKTTPPFNTTDYFNPGSWLPLQFYYYYGTADLGGILGLTAVGLDPVLNFGYLDSATPYYNFSSYDYESVGDFDPGSTYRLTLNTSVMKLFNVLLTVDPASMWNGKPFAIASVNGTFGPISAALNYYTNQNTAGGLVGADVRFMPTMGDLSFGVDVSGKYDVSNANAWGYGVAVKVAYTTLVNIAAGLAGSSSGLGNLGMNVNFVLMPALGIDLDLSMNLATGAATAINGGDFSVWYKIDKSTVRLGYLYSTIGLGNVYAIDRKSVV